MSMKIRHGKCILSVVSVYAPQTGCPEEKEEFWRSQEEREEFWKSQNWRGGGTEDKRKTDPWEATSVDVWEVTMKKAKESTQERVTEKAVWTEKELLILECYVT